MWVTCWRLVEKRAKGVLGLGIYRRFIFNLAFVALHTTWKKERNVQIGIEEQSVTVAIIV